MEESWKEEVRLSYIVDTIMDLSEDSFSEVLNNLGYHFIKLVKIDFSQFIFTFLKAGDIYLMVWEDLNIWVKSYAKAQLKDMIQPRLVWIKVFGLLYVVSKVGPYRN